MLKQILKITLLFVLLFCFEQNVSAKDLYVSTNGSDAVAYSTNDINNSWLTVAHAMDEVLAGDRVYFRQGSYPVNARIQTKGANYSDGTSESPIAFLSYQGEQATWTTTQTLYVIGVQHNYWRVYDIDFSGDAPIWFYLGEDIPAEHFEIRYANVKLGTGGDNTGFVKASSRSNYLVVENCSIQGPGQAVHQNTSLLYPAGADFISIKNNVLWDAPIGIYLKTNNDEIGGEVAFNYIYNTSRNSIQTNSQYMNFHDNVIGANCGPFQINEGNGFALGDNNTLNHNTIFSGGIRMHSEDGTCAEYNTVINNIAFSRVDYCMHNTWDYNLYTTGAAIGANDIGNTAPMFVGGATPSTISGFALTTESSGYQMASDAKDMGADISLVGVQGDLPDTFLPSSPSGLSVM